MSTLPHVTVYILGLDPLTVLTPMDGIIRSLRRLNWPVTLVGVSSHTHDSANILSAMFDHVIILNSSGYQRFHELKDRTADVAGAKIIIPADRNNALALAPHRVHLAEAGYLCPGPSHAQASKSEMDTIEFLKDNGVHTVHWHTISDIEDIEALHKKLSYPLKMVTPDRQKRWIINDYATLKVMTDRCLKQQPAAMIRELKTESVYQVATVIDSQWKPTGWAMAREIARDRHAEPWMFMGLNNPRLMKTAEITTAILEYQGPVTMRFIRFDDSSEYLLDTFSPVLPVWTDLAAASGVNLPGRFMESALRMPVTQTPWVTAPGQLMTFNSFDISVSSDAWLNIAGRGGY